MKLNKEQYKAAVHLNGPMLVLAGPGSGKTHLLVERIRMMIENSGIDPSTILVITFSKKAARQMQQRFEKKVRPKSYPVTFGTFHAVFYHILKECDPSVDTLITEEERDRIIREASDVFDLSDGTDIIAGLISSYKNLGDEMFERDEHARHMSTDERSNLVRACEYYEKRCRDEGLLDFDDMIVLTRKLLYKHEGILRRWQKIYRYFLVDEFQDINRGQYDVLRLLAGDDKNVFAVGDDDQSIYAFRGSRPELMKKFLREFPGCRQVTLSMNYRCSSKIIGSADTLIRHNTDRIERPMQEHLPSKSGGEVVIVNSESSIVQASFVCDMIERLCADEGYRMNDFAVLYRSDHCATQFVAKALERGMRIRTVDGVEVSKEEKINSAYLRAKEETASKGDYFLIMNNPKRGLSRESLRHSKGDHLMEMRKYYSKEPEKLIAVADLEKTIREYDGKITCEEFDHRDVINVMTAHASKGLEFRCVFVIGLQEGLFPHYRNTDGDLVMEERRLMYVAMTRAKERLYICSVATQHGKRPSRFVSEAIANKRYVSDVYQLTRI